MQWERLILEKQIKHYAIPMVPIIFIWSFSFFIFSFEQNYDKLGTLNYLFSSKLAIILCLIFCFLVDVKLLNPFRKIWFKKIRLIATILAILSYLI